MNISRFKALEMILQHNGDTESSLKAHLQDIQVDVPKLCELLLEYCRYRFLLDNQAPEHAALFEKVLRLQNLPMSFDCPTIDSLFGEIWKDLAEKGIQLPVTLPDGRFPRSRATDKEKPLLPITTYLALRCSQVVYYWKFGQLEKCLETIQQHLAPYTTDELRNEVHKLVLLLIYNSPANITPPVQLPIQQFIEKYVLKNVSPLLVRFLYSYYDISTPQILHAMQHLFQCLYKSISTDNEKL